MLAMLKPSVALANSSYENSTDLSTVIPVNLGEATIEDSDALSKLLPQPK